VHDGGALHRPGRRREGRGQDQVRGRQRLQGQGRLQVRGQRLRRQERLQGQGLRDDEDREGVHRRRRQGRQGRRKEEVTMFARRALGHGIGLRTPHYAAIEDGEPAIDWFEVISENFMVEGGNARRVLRAVRDRWPLVLHGVSLSIGSVDPLDRDYLDRLRRLAEEIEPAYV